MTSLSVPHPGLADDEGKLKLATDGKPYTTLGYTNGPGAYATGTNFTRPNATSTNTCMYSLSQCFSLSIRTQMATVYA